MSFVKKLREGTIIRILVFFMYKLIFLLSTFLLLTLMNSFVEKFTGFPLNISVINLLSFIVISNIIDVFKYLVFQGKILLTPDYEEAYFWSDKFLRIFLDTGNNTIYLFIGSILQYILYYLYVAFFIGIPNQ